MSDTALRVHQIIPASRVNGPGLRLVIWVQGCTLACPGCFNPQTHPAVGGILFTPADLMTQIRTQKSIEGITLSGGEPLQQMPALLALLQPLRRDLPHLSTLLFTGYSWNEIQRMPRAADLLACLDVVIAGRFQEKQRLAAGLIGSANKTVHFLTGRHSPADLEAVPPAEIIIDPAGRISLSGIDPLNWNQVQ